MNRSGLVVLAFAITSVAYGASVTWTVNNAHLQPGYGGGTVTGSFVYDADSNIYSDWALTVSDVSSPFSIVTFTPGNSSLVTASATGFSLMAASVNETLAFAFVGGVTGSTMPLTDAGGTLNLNGIAGDGLIYDSNPPVVNGPFVSGSVSAPSSPSGPTGPTGGGSGPTVTAKVISNTNGIVNGTCQTPPSVTSFTTSSPQVWIYFAVSGASAGNTATINFVRPDGGLYQSYNATAGGSIDCFSYAINIAGASAASYPGTWTVQVLWNGSSSALFSLNFTIGSSSSPPPSSGLTLGAHVISNTTGIVNGSCTTPSSVTSFTTASSQVWLYFAVSGANTGDTATINFIRPDGVVYQTFNGTTGGSDWCFTYEIPIAGASAASYPGTWTVQTFWNSSSSALFSLNFTIASASSPPPTTTGSTVLPQFAFGGGWYSALYFTNSSSSPASFSVGFVSDSGAPLFLPSISGSSTQVSLAANGTAIIEAPNVGGLSQGYAVFTLPNGVSGYGVFRQSIAGLPDQEAVVPFSSSSGTAASFVWDDTNYVTSVAIVNPGSTAASITITVWNASGNVIGSSILQLAPNTKTEAVLSSLSGLAGMAGNRGAVQFSASGGNVAVLGLRFNGPAFTSIPATP